MVNISHTIKVDFYNNDDVQQNIEDVVVDILNVVAKDLYDIFLRDYVLKYAYSGDNDWYVPSMEFLNAWDLSDSERNGNLIEASISFNPSKVLVDLDTWKHGSQFEGWGSAANFMDDLLNTEGSTSRLGWNNREKAYWDEFQRDMFESGKLDEMFARKAKEFGIY